MVWTELIRAAGIAAGAAKAAKAYLVTGVRKRGIL
jgi:hypothetical protein